MSSYINNLKNRIDKALDKYLPSEKAEPKVVHKAMRYSVFSGGKRIRPAITLEACVSCGKNSQDAIPGACAIELVHTYSLIHDDLPAMDDDDYRRLKPTCHKVFGEANAILAGDALLTLAFNIIAKGPDAASGIAVIKELSDAIGTYGMVGGQALDIEIDLKNKKDLVLINRLKTARLFEASAKIGALAAKADKAKVAAMAKYGTYLGEAFQIIDDILDGDGYAKALGASRALKNSAILIKKAKDALKIFAKNGDGLKDIADQVIERIA